MTEQDSGTEFLPPSIFNVVTEQGSSQLWERIGPDVLSIEKRAYAGVLSQEYETVTPGYIEHEFSSSATNLFLLYTGEQLVGFTTLYPHLHDYPQYETERTINGMTKEAYDEMQKRSLIVGWTAIDPDYQKKGGWSKLMDALDKRAAELTDYDFMIRFARADNTYSSKVIKRYEGHIVYHATTDDEFGKQDILRIKIPRTA